MQWQKMETAPRDRTIICIAPAAMQLVGDRVVHIDWYIGFASWCGPSLFDGEGWFEFEENRKPRPQFWIDFVEPVGLVASWGL